MKLYLLQSSFGQYSDSYEVNEGIFDTMEQAELVKTKIEAHYEILIDKEPPYSEDDYYEHKLTEEQQKEYSAFMSTKIDASDYNSSYISELELNDYNFKV